MQKGLQVNKRDAGDMALDFMNSLAPKAIRGTEAVVENVLAEVEETPEVEEVEVEVPVLT